MQVVRVLFVYLLICFCLAGYAQASFLDETAGISASTQLYLIDLDSAEKAFKTIESRDMTCIIGLVALDGYDATHDVYVYVTATGKMIAYYLNSEPASKVLDWVGYKGGKMTLEGCKLEDAMNKVCRAVGQKLTNVKYFDYRYPTATTIKLMADMQTGNAHKKLKYTVPSADSILNASWSSAVKVTKANARRDSVLSVDGNEVHRHSQPCEGWQFADDNIDIEIFVEDTSHELDIYNLHLSQESYAAVVLVCAQ